MKERFPNIDDKETILYEITVGGIYLELEDMQKDGWVFKDSLRICVEQVTRHIWHNGITGDVRAMIESVVQYDYK